MSKIESRKGICPRCGKEYSGVPAQSRVNQTLICPDCGTREALESIGVKPEEQEKILATIHRHSGPTGSEASRDD